MLFVAERYYLHIVTGFSILTSLVTWPHATFNYYYYPIRVFIPHKYFSAEMCLLLVRKGQLMSFNDLLLTCSFNMAVIHNWLPIQQPADSRCR
jgi:hypothetical protein